MNWRFALIGTRGASIATTTSPRPSSPRRTSRSCLATSPNLLLRKVQPAAIARYRSSMAAQAHPLRCDTSTPRKITVLASVATLPFAFPGHKPQSLPGRPAAKRHCSLVRIAHEHQFRACCSCTSFSVVPLSSFHSIRPFAPLPSTMHAAIEHYAAARIEWSVSSIISISRSSSCQVRVHLSSSGSLGCETRRERTIKRLHRSAISRT